MIGSRGVRAFIRIPCRDAALHLVSGCPGPGAGVVVNVSSRGMAIEVDPGQAPSRGEFIRVGDGLNWSEYRVVRVRPTPGDGRRVLLGCRLADDAARVAAPDQTPECAA